MREALQEDAELDGNDLLPDLPAEPEPEPAPGSKHRLKKEVESRRASSPSAQPSNSLDAQNSSASRYQESPAASEASEEDLSEDAMLARLIEAQQGGAGPRQQQDDEEELDAWETVPRPETSSANGDAELAKDLEGVHLAPDAALHHNSHAGSEAIHPEDHQLEAEDRTGKILPLLSSLAYSKHVDSPCAYCSWLEYAPRPTSPHLVL